MRTIVNRAWHRLAITGAAAGAAAGIALVLGSASPPPAARAAAQAVTAEAACPPQTDPTPISRTSTAFARIDGITGDSADAKHAGFVDLTAVRAGLCAVAGGKATFDPVVVEKQVDRASVPLAAKAFTGAHINSIHIVLTTAGANPIDFLTYDLTDARVVSVRQVKHAATLAEVVTFDFTRISYTFVPQKADGTAGAAITACFDVAANRTC